MSTRKVSGIDKDPVDWYSLTHFSMGVLLSVVLKRFLPEISVWQLLVAAFAVSLVFEVTEYLVGVDLFAGKIDYNKDSVVNSHVDTLFLVGGALLGYHLSAPEGLLVVVLAELFLGALIRDNASLMMLNLALDSPALVEWQSRAPLTYVTLPPDAP